ncbi:E3 ubiquitin-protein ligase listerin [Entamoeba marina]
MKFIVECVERNEFTQGFSYDLLATIIEKNTLNYPFTNEEVQVLLEVLKRYPAPQFVYDMLVRQFQYIFMLTIEHTADDIELLYDDVEIEDEFMDYVEQMEDLVISSISYLPSFEIGDVLKSVFFRLFPTHFGYNHLNYLEAMITRLKKLDMIQHCVLPLEQQIDVLLHSFQSTKHIIHSLVDVKQPLLNPVQLVKLLTTSSLDHLQLLLSVDIIEHLSTFHPFISPLIKHILELVATPNLFHYTHVSLRKTLLKLLPLFLNIVGLEPLRLMTKQILTCGNATNFIIESCKIIPDLQCVIDDAIALYPIQQFNEMIISYASTIKTPLLVPTPKELIDAVPVTYIHTISLIVSLFHLKDNPITNPQYFDYYLIDIYQKLSNGIPIENPKTTPLDAIQRFLSKNEIEKYILFHAINELKEWFNSSQECIEFIAQHYDTSTSYSTRFFFSSYLSPLHVEWLEKKIGGTVKRFFMANIKPDLEGLQELSVMYPIIQFPSHLRPLLKYMFNVSITKNQQLPFLHLLYHCFSTSCSLCFESLEDEEMLSQIYQFLLSILEIDNHTIKRAVLKLSQILLTHSLPPKLLTSNTEGIVLSFRVTLLEFITESILKNSNIELVSEILLESELLSEIDFLSTSLPKHIPELLKILTGKAPILVKICAGQLLGATMNFSNENVYIDMDDFEKQNYKPLPQPIETFFDKSISMFSKNSVKSKQALIIFVLGLLRRLKNSSSDCKPWAVAYLTLHNIEQFIHSLYAVLPNQSTPTSLSQVISIIRSVDEDEYLGILGLYCMFNLVQVLPNVVRQWCISLKRNAPKKVKEFFGKNICGPVLEDEVQKILSWKEIDGFKLKLQLDCKAVTVVYTNDELVFETQLTFPQTYPLDMINVNIGTNKVGVSDAKSYLWKRMLTLNLMTRDVSIVDACLLWKQQLDKQFDDSDACPICYSLFYLRTTTIPNVSCKCCRKKFHKQCIFGWFRSTGRNDCPLCTRNFYGNN